MPLLTKIGYALLTFAGLTAATTAKSQIAIDVWSPPFNTERKHEVQSYAKQEAAASKWQICVAIPHLKDTYWMAVNYGVLEEARRLGVSATIHEAGGYDKLDVQRQQIQSCMADKGQALIIGSVSLDGLADLVKQYTSQGKPVIDLINGIRSPDLTARVAADFFEMGEITAKALAKNGQGSKVLWLPGPKGAGWSEAGNAGFMSGLRGTPWQVTQTVWGDTGLAVQLKLISEALSTGPIPDAIVGTAVSAEAAVQELRRRNLTDKVKVFSYYFSPTVHRNIERGNVVAAPSDVPTLQTRLAMDVAVRALEGKPFPRHFSARLQMIDKSSLRAVNLRDSLAPDGFRPIFNVN